MLDIGLKLAVTLTINLLYLRVHEDNDGCFER